MEDIIQIAKLVIAQNPPMPEIQKQLILALSMTAIIPTAIVYCIKELIEKMK